MENKNLLPPGFRDDLSPTTETEHIFMNKIIKIFSSNGYKIIKPPLVEYLKSYENKKSICIIFKVFQALIIGSCIWPASRI